MELPDANTPYYEENVLDYVFDTLTPVTSSGVAEAVLKNDKGELISAIVTHENAVGPQDDTKILTALASYRLLAHRTLTPYFYAKFSPDVALYSGGELSLTVFIGSSGSLNPLQTLKKVKFEPNLEFWNVKTGSLLNTISSPYTCSEVVGPPYAWTVTGSSGTYVPLQNRSLFTITLIPKNTTLTDTTINIPDIKITELKHGNATSPETDYLSSIPNSYTSSGIKYVVFRYAAGGSFLKDKSMKYLKLPTAGLSLTDLSDVLITSPAAGQLLTYNGEKYVNSDVTISSSNGTSNGLTIGVPTGNQTIMIGNSFGTANLDNNNNTSNVLIGTSTQFRYPLKNLVLIGSNAGRNRNTLSDSVIVGTEALAHDTLNASSGENNVVIGNNALLGVVPGSNNVCIGTNIGRSTQITPTVTPNFGSNVIAIGRNAGSSNTTVAQASNCILIGPNTKGTVQNVIIFNTNPLKNMQYSAPGFYVNSESMRQKQATSGKKLYYDTTDQEIFYA